MSQSNTKTRREDGVLSPDELKKAIDEYKARYGAGENSDCGTGSILPIDQNDGEPVGLQAVGDTPDTNEEKLNAIKEAKEARVVDAMSSDLEAANDTIAHQDEDIQFLLDLIDSLIAERDFNSAAAEDCIVNDGADCEDCNTDGEDAEPDEEPEENTDCDDTIKQDDADEAVPDTGKEDLKPGEVMNADSIDAIVRERVKIGIAASKLNLDGVENMSMIQAKKAIIKAVRPAINLDGKGRSYVDAAFGMALEEINSERRKDTSYQIKQMFNGDAKGLSDNRSMADIAREKMLSRRNKNNKED